MTKKTTRNMRWAGHAKLWDDAWDELLEAVAECRADHPQAEMTNVHVGHSLGDVIWSLEAQEAG